MTKYYRVTYKGIGIYKALKLRVWEVCSDPIKEWDIIKNSESINWLPVPHYYKENNYSYFTELGFSKFNELVMPILVKWLEKDKIKVETFNLDLEDIVYQDEYQIVVEKEER